MTSYPTRKSTFSSRVTLYDPTQSTKRARSTQTTSSSSSPKKPKLELQSQTKPKLEESETEQDSKPIKQRAPKPFKNSLDKPHKEPSRWKEVYGIIQEQRKTIIAPVDTMGCEQGGRSRDALPPSEDDNKLSILVSLMLSSQTKDPVTHAAVASLRDNLRGGLSLQGLLDATAQEIDSCICKVGFHNIKTGNLMKLALRLRDEHDGKVPEDLHALLAINGVGPKMAFLFLQAIGINQGIGVDTHVHRITNRLGWHKPATTQPEQTRLNLESWLPKELHPKINLMLVGFGQKICLPVGPRCDLCDVAKAGTGRLCPSKKAVSPRKGRAKKEEEAQGDGPKIEVKVEENFVVKDEEKEMELKEVVKVEEEVGDKSW